ncbi:FecR family protein [Turneriella parva]|nr:FecR family protein [Turneriella parva]
MKMHANLKQVFAAILLLATGTLCAVEGRVTYLSGNAEIKSSGKTTGLKLGTVLREGDTVVTKAKAKVGVQMSDGASFFMNQNTSLEIRPGSQYYQTDGAISMLFRKSGRDASGKWAIKTPVVTAGVRGTGFTVEASKSQTRLVLFTGKVIMTDFVRETGLQSDPNLMMQDFLNDIELNAGTALRYDGSDVKKEKIDLKGEPMKSLHDEHQQHEKSDSWKKANQDLK